MDYASIAALSLVFLRVGIGNEIIFKKADYFHWPIMLLNVWCEIDGQIRKEAIV